MYNDLDHKQMLALSQAYLEMLEGYKKFPAAKVQDQSYNKPDTAKGENQARKMDRVRAVMTDNDTGMGNVARQFNKRAPLQNQRRGLEKKFKKPAVMGKDASDTMLKGKIEKPSSR